MKSVMLASMLLGGDYTEYYAEVRK
jgi:hypothetical protein